VTNHTAARGARQKRHEMGLVRGVSSSTNPSSNPHGPRPRMQRKFGRPALRSPETGQGQAGTPSARRNRRAPHPGSGRRRCAPRTASANNGPRGTPQPAGQVRGGRTDQRGVLTQAPRTGRFSEGQRHRARRAITVGASIGGRPSGQRGRDRLPASSWRTVEVKPRRAEASGAKHNTARTETASGCRSTAEKER